MVRLGSIGALNQRLSLRIEGKGRLDINELLSLVQLVVFHVVAAYNLSRSK